MHNDPTGILFLQACKNKSDCGCAYFASSFPSDEDVEYSLNRLQTRLFSYAPLPHNALHLCFVRYQTQSTNDSRLSIYLRMLAPMLNIQKPASISHLALCSVVTHNNGRILRTTSHLRLGNPQEIGGSILLIACCKRRKGSLC